MRSGFVLLALVLTLFAGAGSASAAPVGTITEFSAGLNPNSDLRSVTAGPDGNLWFTDQGTPAVGRITPSGKITEFTNITPAGAQPLAIVPGPDGNLWFTQPGYKNTSRAIGRITPTGQITEFTNGLPDSDEPIGIVPGPDGNLWFTEINAIGRITPTGQITLFTSRDSWVGRAPMYIDPARVTVEPARLEAWCRRSRTSATSSVRSGRATASSRPS